MSFLSFEEVSIVKIDLFGDDKEGEKEHEICEKTQRKQSSAIEELNSKFKILENKFENLCDKQEKINNEFVKGFQDLEEKTEKLGDMIDDLIQLFREFAPLSNLI